jgi:hypothetical protein
LEALIEEKDRNMPKIQPPKGYIKATDVKNRLHISDAMVRYYVQKEKIGYLVPPGRKQGFYLEKDVNRLANELDAFLYRDDAEEETTFDVAKKEDLLGIIKLGVALFSPGSNINPEPPQWIIKALEKNPEIRFTLKRKGELLGYVSIVPFKPNNEKAQRCLEVEFLRDVNITPDDIETFDAGKHIHLYLMAIGIDPKLTRLERRTQGAKLINKFIDEIVKLGSRGVIIEKITARGDTRSGIKLLQAFGFSEMPPPAPGKRAFIIDVEKSGAPAILQYKQALKESGVLETTTASQSV